VKIVKIVGRFLEEIRSKVGQDLGSGVPYYMPLLFTPTEVAESRKLCLSVNGLPTLNAQEKRKSI